MIRPVPHRPQSGTTMRAARLAPGRPRTRPPTSPRKSVNRTIPDIVNLPPDTPARPDGSRVGGWWHRRGDGRVACDLCPRACSLNEGDKGFCFVRENRGGQVVLTTYGRSTGFCVDPIEKK